MAVQKFPGLIDIHVHLREPGATQKEDFLSGSRAAVKGGFTFVCDMPNNPSVPTITIERLQEKIVLSQKKALCDVGFHYGTDGKNLDTFQEAAANPKVFGLKIYCNSTTGELLVNNEAQLDKVFGAWQSDKPILVHAEGDMLAICLSSAKRRGRRLHVCHISEISELTAVRRAKEVHQNVTVGVTPHHLFLTEADVKKLGAYALMKPSLGDEETRTALWEALSDGTIDVVESDHAPHSKKDKGSSAPPMGVPGLETTFPLLVHSFVEGKVSLEKIRTLLYDNPKKIFGIPDQKDIWIEFDPQKSFIVGKNGYETKCGWSPFDGWELNGPIERVVLRGKALVEHGKIL